MLLTITPTSSSAVADKPAQQNQCNIGRNCAVWNGMGHFQRKFPGEGRSSTNEFWRQKTRVPGLSRGVVCMILCLAVLIQYRRVTHTHRHTHRQTHDNSYYPRIACAAREKTGIKFAHDDNSDVKTNFFNCTMSHCYVHWANHVQNNTGPCKSITAVDKKYPVSNAREITAKSIMHSYSVTVNCQLIL